MDICLPPSTLSYKGGSKPVPLESRLKTAWLRSTSLGIEVAGVHCPSKGEKWRVTFAVQRSLSKLWLLSGEIDGLALQKQ